MLNRVPLGLFRDAAKIGAPDVNELLPPCCRLRATTKNRFDVTAKFNAE
jgi:hypothetical protein